MAIINKRSVAFTIFLFSLSLSIVASQENGSNPQFRLRKIMGHIKPNVLASQTPGFLRKNNVLGDRPAAVQQEVDRAFEYNKRINDDYWLYNGSDRYGLLGFYDEAFLTSISLTNQEQKDVYIIDVGCARGRWGEHAQEVLLKHELYRQSGKHFHIISVTGGQECQEKVKKTDHVTLHQFNQFKIENIDEEFAKRGFNLNNKVDLIVSNWTLRHLADPFGTLKRMYSLLVPGQGMVASTGFFFALSDSDTVKMFPWGNTYMCSDSNVTSLFRLWRSGNDIDQFLLKRNDNQELNVPIAYTGVIKKLKGRYDCASYVVTVFENNSPLRSNIQRFEDKKSEVHAFLSRDTYYWNKGSQQSEQLYYTLKAAHQAYIEKRRKELGITVIKELDELEEE